jgi:hypothetical protein
MVKPHLTGTSRSGHTTATRQLQDSEVKILLGCMKLRLAGGERTGSKNSSVIILHSRKWRCFLGVIGQQMFSADSKGVAPLLSGDGEAVDY